jgi:hypothetical protein
MVSTVAAKTGRPREGQTTKYVMTDNNRNRTMKKILALAAVAAAVAFASSKASASQIYPNIPLTISATVQYSTEVMTTNGSKVTSAPLQTVSFNNKSIIAEVEQRQSTNLPAGSYLAWNPWDEDIYVTNSSGFSYFPGFYLDLYDENLTGQAAQSLTTGAGTEKDLTGIYFELDFDETNYIETYGLGTLNWTYGTATGGNQPVTLSASMSFSGSDESYINDYQAIITSGKISGSGKGTDPTDQFPFWYNY